MFLDMPLSGCVDASLTYTFELLPVKADPMDALTRMIHDANDEISELKDEITALKSSSIVKCEHRIVLSLRSSMSVVNNKNVIWNLVEPRLSGQDFFELSEDHTRITVKKEGLYQTYVRLAAQDTAGQRYTYLFVDGIEVARSQCGQNTGYLNSTNMSDILFLAVNAVVTVLHHSSQITHSHGPSNHFYMIKL